MNLAPGPKPTYPNSGNLEEGRTYGQVNMVGGELRGN